MSVNGDAARREMWAGRIERCLASGMAIGEWCESSPIPLAPSTPSWWTGTVLWTFGTELLSALPLIFHGR